MLTTSDLAQIAVDLAVVRGDREESVVLRRGAATLAAQAVRIARLSGGQERNGEGTQQATARVVVLGGTTLDIEPGDRFNDASGVLYEVVFVRPNRRSAVIAEARMVE